jgi:hypothetical protein
MKRVFLILSIAALALPAAALGKGPSEASISGPGAGGGGGGGLTFTGCCTPESPTMMLAEHAGFFPAVFAQQPDPMIDRRPKAYLGPKYTITWTVPGPNNEVWKLRQEVYPYAQPAPFTYMKRGQKVFGQETRGGWFRASPRLKETLVSAGLPAKAPASAPSSQSSTFPTSLVGLMIAILLITTAATAVGLRSIVRWPFPSRSTSTT